MIVLSQRSLRSQDELYRTSHQTVVNSTLDSLRSSMAPSRPGSARDDRLKERAQQRELKAHAAAQAKEEALMEEKRLAQEDAVREEERLEEVRRRRKAPPALAMPKSNAEPRPAAIPPTRQAWGDGASDGDGLMGGALGLENEIRRMEDMQRRQTQGSSKGRRPGPGSKYNIITGEWEYM